MTISSAIAYKGFEHSTYLTSIVFLGGGWARQGTSAVAPACLHLMQQNNVCMLCSFSVHQQADVYSKYVETGSLRVAWVSSAKGTVS